MRRIPTSLLLFALLVLSVAWAGQIGAQTYKTNDDALCSVWTCTGTVTGFDPLVMKPNVTCTLSDKTKVVICVYNLGQKCDSVISIPVGYQVCEGVLASDNKTYCQIYYPECK